MDAALKTATVAVLPRLSILPDASHDVDRLEYARLRNLRARGQMRPLAARLAILTTLGWKRTTIAEAMDVSRVTLNNWLRDHTSGGETFRPYGPDALEGDPDTGATSEVTAPITNKLTARNAEALGGVRFEHDKFVVPEGFVRPIAALWRVAYKARGHELTTDPEIAAAGDALDIIISLMLRRGVTNLAIAKAAGVTHRAVLDRMNRARQRGLILECGGDDCEAFRGEETLRKVYIRSEEQDASEWLALDTDEDNFRLVPIRVTSARPARYWLQTMIDLQDEAHPAVLLPPNGEEHVALHARLHIAQQMCTDDIARVAYNELFTSVLLGRMNEASFDSNTLSKRFRGGAMFVPAQLLYTEAMSRAGVLPQTAKEAFRHIPVALLKEYFEGHDAVMKCFTDPDEIESEFEATVKHKADAKTRRGAVA